MVGDAWFVQPEEYPGMVWLGDLSLEHIRILSCHIYFVVADMEKYCQCPVIPSLLARDGSK